jgi:hypothetical protein
MIPLLIYCPAEKGRARKYSKKSGSFADIRSNHARSN